MNDDDEKGRVAQEQFEEGVLDVVGIVLGTGRRVDLAADVYLAESSLPRGDGDLRADLIICVAECLRLVAALSGGRSGVVEDFPEFAQACRSAPVLAVGDPATTRIQRALRRITTGLLAFRRG